MIDVCTYTSMHLLQRVNLSFSETGKFVRNCRTIKHKSNSTSNSKSLSERKTKHIKKQRFRNLIEIPRESALFLCLLPPSSHTCNGFIAPNHRRSDGNP